LSNISDFDYAKDACHEYLEQDSFILSQLNENIKKINNAYDDFNFIEVVDIINNHVIELSG
jgi:isoleucyl-tRNA synthetase